MLSNIPLRVFYYLASHSFSYTTFIRKHKKLNRRSTQHLSSTQHFSSIRIIILISTSVNAISLFLIYYNSSSELQSGITRVVFLLISYMSVQSFMFIALKLATGCPETRIRTRDRNRTVTKTNNKIGLSIDKRERNKIISSSS